MSAEAGNSVRSVERAVDILRCFDRESPILAVTDLQRRLGLSRPTLYRLLETLEGKGLVRSFGDPKRFQLGHGVVELETTLRGYGKPWAIKVVSSATTGFAPATAAAISGAMTGSLSMLHDTIARRQGAIG